MENIPAVPTENVYFRSYKTSGNKSAATKLFQTVLIWEILKAKGPQTRAQIVAATGYSPDLVKVLIRRLQAVKLVEVAGTAGIRGTAYIFRHRPISVEFLFLSAPAAPSNRGS